MTKIIVTGGLGFIGTNLIIKLLEKKYKILNLDKCSYSSNSYLNKKKKNYKYLKIDIAKSNIKNLKKIFLKFKPNLIINLAAESHVDRSIDNPLKFIEQNISLTLKLLIASVKCLNNNKNFRFIHIGTDEVYGDMDLKVKKKFDEHSQILPNNPYSASKASCNHLVRSFMKTYNLKSVIINPSNNYGKFQYPEKMIPKSLLNILYGKPVEIYGKGLNMRNWTHVSDTVEAITKIIKLGKVGFTYNISSNDCLSNNHIFREIKKAFNKNKKISKKIKFKYIKDRPGHDKKYFLDNSSVRKLGWRPKVNLTEGLAELIQWYSNKNNLRYFKNYKIFKKRLGKNLI